MVIGISGNSGSGKSTIAKIFAEENNFRYLSLDNYWIPGDEKQKFYVSDRDDEHTRVYELPIEYNGEQLVKDLDDRNTVIEGFCLMCFPEIRNLVNYHFHVDTPWEICTDRRKSRDGAQSKSVFGWLKLGERGNQLLNGFQKDLKNTIILNGLDTPYFNSLKIWSICLK